MDSSTLPFVPILGTLFKKKTQKNQNAILDSEKISKDDMIEYLRNNKFCDNSTVPDKNIYTDLEVYNSVRTDSRPIISKIDHTTTVFGYMKLISFINTSITDIDILNKRQTELKKMSSILDDNKLDIRKHLDTLKKLQKDVIWALKPKTLEEKSIIDGLYFSGGGFLDSLNKFEDPLNVYTYFKIYLSPLYGLLSPLVMMIFPYLYLKFFTKIKLNFGVYIKILKMSIFGDVFSIMGTPSNGRSKISKYFSLFLSIVFYIQNLVNSISISINTHTLINIIHNKLSSVQQFCKTGLLLVNSLSEHFDFKQQEHPIKYLEHNEFNGEHTILSNKGKLLYAFKNTIKYDSLNELLTSISYIDYMVSINTLMDKQDICYPTYIDSSSPIITLEDMYHPYLGKNAIKNNIHIGNSNPNNIIITGPNAGGKSTCIKSIALSVLFGQTLGVCFSKKASITPFKILNSYLNIPDCKGKESLFEAEMHRARDHIELCKNLDKKDHSFIIMDEIFSSTNPDEGISGAFAIADKLSEYKNSITIITTHFNYLTKLEDSKKFKNYKIPCLLDKDNNISYPYKITAGISTQNIALELLKAKGFDNDIINKAKQICQTFVSQNKQNIDNNDAKITTDIHKTHLKNTNLKAEPIIINNNNNTTDDSIASTTVEDHSDRASSSSTNTPSSSSKNTVNHEAIESTTILDTDKSNTNSQTDTSQDTIHDETNTHSNTNNQTDTKISSNK